jgi:DNA-binding GntR family transcriptional regulator
MVDIVETEVGTAEGPEPGTGAADTAYRWIRRAILSGEFRSGDKLSEKLLAERIGVSRTPVREALARLGSQGLVVLEHYRRGFVARFTPEDAQEILRLRALLEGHAAERAATRIGAEDLDRLDHLQDRMERAYADLGYARYLPLFEDLNATFHAIIATAADSPRIQRIFETNLELPAVGLSIYREADDPRTVRSLAQHREIIAALRARNPQWARHAMSAHFLCLLLAPAEGG